MRGKNYENEIIQIYAAVVGRGLGPTDVNVILLVRSHGGTRGLRLGLGRLRSGCGLLGRFLSLIPVYSVRTTSSRL